MADDFVVGKDAKLYYNTGTFASPTWVEITRAIDVSVSLGKNDASISSRESEWEQMGGGLKTAEVEFDYLHAVGADTVFDALLSAYLNDTVTEFAAMDGAIATSGNQGLRAYCIVFSMDYDQSLEEGQKFSFGLQPSRFVESAALKVPVWLDVA